MADDLANEAIFPGNRFAFEALKAELATGRLVAFVGSGVSIPLAPSWTGLLSDLIKRGLKEGLIQPADEAVLRELVHDDPLGSGLIGHSQKMTVAARATAEKKTVGQRS